MRGWVWVWGVIYLAPDISIANGVIERPLGQREWSSVLSNRERIKWNKNPDSSEYTKRWVESTVVYRRETPYNCIGVFHSVSSLFDTRVRQAKKYSLHLAQRDLACWMLAWLLRTKWSEIYDYSLFHLDNLSLLRSE